MLYRYTYRNSNGQIDSGIIDVTSRSEVFSTLKARNLVPISIAVVEKEGQIPSSIGKMTVQKNRWWKAIGAFILLISVVAIALICYLSKTSKPIAIQRARPKQRIEEVLPAHKSTREPSLTRTDLADTNIVEIQKQVQPSTGIDDSPPTQPQTNKLTIVRKKGAIDPKKVFPMRSDRTLNRVLSLRLGESVVGNIIPPNFDAAFEESLRHPIEINPDDTPEIKELKESVIAARDYISAEMKAKDQTASQVLAEAITALRSSSEYRKNLIRVLSRKSAEGESPEELHNLLKDANSILQEQIPGAKPVRIKNLELLESQNGTN